MSKNSNEKQLNNRLNNIFTDLDKPITFPGLDASSDLTGWIWEMDPSGMVTGCSPDIEVFLEMPAQQFIGNSIESFTDFRFESANLPTDPNRAMMPTTVPITFQTSDGIQVPTETYILAKLDDDGSILSWRSITSVLVEEPTEPIEAEQKSTEKKEPFLDLATLDIIPEIPQPDMTVSDIWKKSVMDTAPLSVEDLLEESKAFQESLENKYEYPSEADPEISQPDDLKTFIVQREPEPGQLDEIPVEEPAPPEEPVSPAPPHGIDPKIFESFAPFDKLVPTSEQQAEEEFSPKISSLNDGETARSSETVDGAAFEQPVAAEIDPIAEPKKDTGPQDDIQTVRYSHEYRVEQEAPVQPAEQIEPVTDPYAEDSLTEKYQVAEPARPSGEELPPTAEFTSTFEKDRFEEEQERPVIETPEAGFEQTTLQEPASESDTSLDWIPEFKTAFRETPEHIEFTSIDPPTTRPIDESMPPPAASDTPVIPEFDEDIPAIPADLDLSGYEQQDAAQLSALTAEDFDEVETPADTKELIMSPDPRIPYRKTDEPSEDLQIAEPEDQFEKIEAEKSLADSNLDDESLNIPEKEKDTTTLDPFPDKPVTGSSRRPTIDTAKLIPSLIRAKETSSDRPKAPRSLDNLITNVEADKNRIKTKELEVHTSSEGVELTLSRGVHELLKIVDDNPDRVWKEDELRLVEQVHSQLELALENANLFQQTQLALAETDERARQLRLLNQMSEEINQTDDLLEIYEIVAEKAKDIFRVQRASVTTITDDRKMLEIVASSGSDPSVPVGTIAPIENSPSEVVIRENRVYIPKAGVGMAADDLKSTMVGPINISNTVIGTLNIGTPIPNAFNDRDANLLTQVLSILNASVENRRLFEQIESALLATEEQARRLAELNRLSEMFSTANSIDEVISLIVENLNRIIATDYWAYSSLNEGANTYRLHLASASLKDLPVVNGQPISLDQPLENSIIEKAARDRRSIIEFNCPDSLYMDVRIWAEQNGIRTAMSTPLFAGNKVIGVVTVSSKLLSAYTVQEENIMQSIASLAGSTIDNRQLLTQIQKRSQQLETSAEVSRVASTMLDPNELLPRVSELIKDGFNLYYAGIFLVDEDGEYSGEPGKWAVLRAGSGDAGIQMVAAGHKLEIGGDSMIGSAISSSQARIALNVGEEASFFRNPYLPETRSEMALPLTSRGHVLGALSIQSENQNAFSQEDITALQTMADQLANAIENARLFEQTEIRAEELTVLNEMARGFTQSMVIDDLVENTYEFTGRLMDANNFYLVLYYPDEEFFEFKLYVESGQIVSPPVNRMKLGNGLTDWIIRNKLPVLMPSDTETHIQSLGVEIRDRIPKSWLGVPMLLGNDVTGVIAVQNYSQENVYNNHALDLLIAVSSQAAVAIDNARRFQATQTRARHEEILRRVTTQVHSTSDPDAILRTAVREVSDALGKPAFVKLSPAGKSTGLSSGENPTPGLSHDPSPGPPASFLHPGDAEEV